LCGRDVAEDKVEQFLGKILRQKRKKEKEKTSGFSF
jgi:hypothetical protein